MASSPSPRLVVAWSGTEFSSVRDLLDAGRLPVLASRLTAGDVFAPLTVPAIAPFALAITLASGATPARHGLLAQVQPAPDGGRWQISAAHNWPDPPLWDRVAAAGKPAAVVGWPGTHGSAPHPLRALVSDLDLAAADTALRPLEPLPGCTCEDLIRVVPADLDPALLGFFIPATGLPAEASADPLVRGLLGQLASLYSAHNTAIALLSVARAPCSPTRVS